MRWDRGYMYNTSHWNTQVQLCKYEGSKSLSASLSVTNYYTHGTNLLASSSGRAEEHLYIVVSM